MTWWDELKAIAKREASAAKEELSRAAERLDEALAKKERELEATPAERVDMLLDEIDEEDAQFGDLEAKLRAEGAERAERAGIEPPAPASPRPQLDHAALRRTLTVEEVPPADSGDRMSHRVTIGADDLSTLRTGGVDAVVADLLAEVMVLDATRRGDTILLRTPTLGYDEVADLVARVMVGHLPGPAPDTPDDPGDEPPRDEGYSAP
jgi:hypothetical protein